MAKYSTSKSKNQFMMLISAFAVLVVGAAALILSKNSSVNYRSGASNVDQNLSDILVKRGTSTFSPCKDLDVKYTYALLGSNSYKTQTTSPRATGKPSPKPSPCTPLVITSALAEPYVGKRVSVTGTFTDGVFYATAISDASSPAQTGKPTGAAKPTNVGKPSMTPRVLPSAVPSGAGKPVDPINPIPPQN